MKELPGMSDMLNSVTVYVQTDVYKYLYNSSRSYMYMYMYMHSQILVSFLPGRVQLGFPLVRVPSCSLP